MPAAPCAWASRVALPAPGAPTTVLASMPNFMSLSATLTVIEESETVTTVPLPPWSEPPRDSGPHRRQDDEKRNDERSHTRHIAPFADNPNTQQTSNHRVTGRKEDAMNWFPPGATIADRLFPSPQVLGS